MSIQSEIDRISGNVSDTLEAIASKGVSVPSDATSDDMAGLVMQISNTSGAIGEITTAESDTVALASGTATNLCSITLSAGVYIIQGNVSFVGATNSTGWVGYRRATVSTTSGSTTLTKGYSVQVPGMPSEHTYLSIDRIQKVSSSTTYYLVGRQNSGASLNATGSIKAIRIA